jgi:hypothetical protein
MIHQGDQPWLQSQATWWWLLHDGKSHLPTWNLQYWLESSTTMSSLPESNNNLGSCLSTVPAQH